MAGRILQRYFSGISRSTFLLSAGSLFGDISTEMLTPVLPIFLTQYLNASGSIVGLVDGIAQAVRNLLDGFSGSISDKLRKRKSITFAGYALGAVAKPLMGFSTIWEGVLAGRLLDRLGAGVRSAPRDALVASSVDGQKRGRGYGLEGVGENAGAFLGPIVTVLLLYVLHVDLRIIFYVAFAPGLLAVATVVAVSERSPSAAAGAKGRAGPRRFPADYWKYLLVTAIFSFGNSTNSFLILRTQELGASIISTTLIYAMFNLVAALVSYPAGFLSDRLGRRSLLLGSYAVFLVVYLGFFVARDLAAIAGLFMFYGLYQAVFRSVGKTFASDFVPDRSRASAIGWYSATAGLFQLVASLIAGTLWDKIGHTSVFLYGAASAASGILALALLVPKSHKSGS